MKKVYAESMVSIILFGGLLISVLSPASYAQSPDGDNKPYSDKRFNTLVVPNPTVNSNALSNLGSDRNAENYKKTQEICYNYKQKVIAQLYQLDKDERLALLNYIFRTSSKAMNSKDSVQYPYHYYFEKYCAEFSKDLLKKLESSSGRLSF
ncbi:MULTISPECIES: hypothetical protein [Flavobacteriaceae]|uniref:hypothetical protein n=1 Tax=Flavobacteriaceae TaxID=49546 RepID=UPI0010AE2374|nr:MULTISPECIES: hypothetical protein [Flavobacteriaceae]NJB37283.1 hypothetical protein [Croceivirga sp. JEA036]TKD61858.1 hypothetical protein FBT53_10800 [Flavobacterium sp. ASW18X]